MTRPHRPCRHAARVALLIVAAGVTGRCLAGSPTPELNEKVVAFASAHRGKKVGDGSCITLAVKALEHAGAKRFPLDQPDGDYAWGRRVHQFKEALPGDILQFRDADFQGKKRLPKGRWISWHYTYPHHTAIVSGVSDGGKVLTILHQNVGPQGARDEQKWVVQEGTLRMDSLQKGGWVRLYRPVERDRPGSRANPPTSSDAEESRPEGKAASRPVPSPLGRG